MHPSFFSDKVAFYSRKCFKYIAATLPECYSIGTNYALIFMLDHKLLFSINLDPYAYSAYMYEGYFAKFVKFIDENMKLRILTWLQISKETCHKLTIWLIIPRVIAVHYTGFHALFRAISNSKIALKLI